MSQQKRLLDFFETAYERYNCIPFIHPDPLELVLRYHDPADQEMAGIFASSFALGNVTAILKCVEEVLLPLGRPAKNLRLFSELKLRRFYRGFRYRFFSENDLFDLIAGVRGCIEDYDSLGSCFRKNMTDQDILGALVKFVDILCEYAGKRIKILAKPEKGSACKRLHLFLRWMIRHDAVDPGTWRNFPSSALIVPMDTHMLRIAQLLGITKRRQADIKTALEVTRFFKTLQPGDPVKYDFCLTRIGIHPDLSYKQLPTPEPFVSIAERNKTL